MSNFYLGSVVLVGLLSTGFLLRFIFSSSAKSKENFKAIDGTAFSSKKECIEYDFLYNKLEFIYNDNNSSAQRRNIASLGLGSSFIKQLKSEGFSDLNSLISNKEQFRKLVELFDVSSMPANDEEKLMK